MEEYLELKERLEITKDYSKFKSHSFNRDVERIERLKNTMTKYGFVGGHPLHVKKAGKYFVVKDGHNRLAAAMALDLPVKFIACNSDITIPEIIASTTPWTTKDHLDSYVREGRIEYMAVDEYMQETGLSLGASMALLAGTSVGSGYQIDKFKRGYYTLGDPWMSEQIKDIVLSLRALEIPYATSSLFVHALSKAILVEELSIRQLKEQIVKYKRLLKKQPTIDDYLLNIQQIYNHRIKTKLGVAFLATEAAKERTRTDTESLAA